MALPRFTIKGILLTTMVLAGYFAMLRQYPWAVIALTAIFGLAVIGIESLWCGDRLYRVDAGIAKLAGFTLAVIGLGLAVSSVPIAVAPVSLLL